MSTRLVATKVTEKDESSLLKPILGVALAVAVIGLVWYLVDKARKDREAEAAKMAALQAQTKAAEQQLAALQAQAKAPSMPGPTAAATASTPTVIEADEATFQQVSAGQKPTIVLFYAPWCGHCKTVKPVFDQLAQELGREFSVVRVDCDKHSSVAQKHGVAAFPTIKRFQSGRPLGGEYSGDRSLHSLAAYARGP